MNNTPIVSVSVGDDVIQIHEGRTERYEKCAIARFVGPEGWGVTMTISIKEIDTFLNSISMQTLFLSYAKEKLGLAA